MKFFYGIVLVSCVLASKAKADTITVDDDGGADYTTIQAAVDAAVDGDEILIMDGFYNEAVTLYNKVLTLRGVDFNTVIIDGSGLAAQALIYSGPAGNHGVVIEGVTVQNSPSIGIWMQQSNGTVEDCVVQLNASDGIHAGILAIENCLMTLNGGHGLFVQGASMNRCWITANGSGGIYRASGSIFATNCLVANNLGPALRGCCWSSATIHMVNSTIAGNSSAFNVIYGSVVLDNSIVWSNSSLGSAANLYMTYCCYPEVWPGPGNFIADPLFTDLSLYTIDSSSPCFDVGSNATVLAAGITTDLGGDPRIRNGTVDVGAWEVQIGSTDCNGNGIPDQDELNPATDCDGNSILDECEIADDLSLDCDGDTVLDSCQMAGDPSLDCDGDLALDSCQIEGDPSLDCDLDGVLDSCQIFSDPSLDCDGDNVLDFCQIEGDPSLDQDGDGVLDSCQCAFSNFCGSTANSTGAPAALGWSGSASISAADLTLTASDLPPSQFGMFFYGSDEWFPVVMGDGLLCVAPPLYRIRTAVFSDPTGVASLTLDYGSKPLSSGKGAVAAFSTWRFQLWYRDPTGGPAGSNTTDGLMVTFCP